MKYNYLINKILFPRVAAEKYLNKMATKKILDLNKKLIPKFIINSRKEAIRDARKMRSVASKAELEWMNKNADKATKVYKSGTREFGGKENEAALRKVREEAIKPFIEQYAKSIRNKRLGTVGAISALSIPSILSVSKSEPYKTSTNKNEQAIADHKVNSNVTLPYWVYDKKTGQLSHKQGNKTLQTFGVMSGLNNQYDGYNMHNEWLKTKKGNYYDLSKHAMTTPSGIFTLASSQYEGLPAFRMVEGERGNTKSLQNRKLPSMLHIMPKSRIPDYEKGVTNKSFGCINLPQNVLDYMVKNNAVNDSLYVLPVQDGNYIYESNDPGHPLKVQYNTKPINITGKNYATKYNLNLNYNEGY